MWPSLANDMLAVASAHGLVRFIAAGNSMGAATALTAALQQPHRILALVLYHPPLLWSDRAARRDALFTSADAHGPDWPYRDLLRGSAASNLPPASDAAWQRLQSIPTLLLCHGDDAVRPIASGVALQQVLPHATLLTADDLAAAEATFPAKAAEWLVANKLIPS